MPGDMAESFDMPEKKIKNGKEGERRGRGHKIMCKLRKKLTEGMVCSRMFGDVSRNYSMLREGKPRGEGKGKEVDILI